MALAPATMVSRRCTQKARGIFLREINAGGLVLLNEVGRDADMCTLLTQSGIVCKEAVCPPD